MFQPVFLSGGVAGAAALGGLEIPHGFQKPLIVLLAPHQDGTKQSRRSDHTTWSLVDLWAADPWASKTCLAKFSSGFLVTWPKHRSCDLYLEVKWPYIQRFTNFASAHSAAKCHAVNFSHISSLPLAGGWKHPSFPVVESTHLVTTER